MSANLFPSKRMTPQRVGLLSAAIPSPFGDGLGLLADAAGYAKDPASLTTGRGLLSLAALLPGIPRKLPLEGYGQFSKYRHALPEGSIYRETSGSRLMDMKGGGYGYGAPDWFFAEVPEMALGQGTNKGLLMKVKSKGLQGQWDFSKPASAQSFLSEAGELTVREQPSKILDAAEEIYVSPQAYSGMKPWEKKRLDGMLSEMQQRGVKVNYVDALPGR